MEQSKSYGAVVASIIIILVLIVGALYFWGRTLETKEAVAPVQQTAEVASDVQTATDTDDSVESLKADISATSDLKDVDAGLKEI